MYFIKQILKNDVVGMIDVPMKIKYANAYGSNKQSSLGPPGVHKSRYLHR